MTCFERLPLKNTGPSPSGRLFAFAEGRTVPGCDDHGVHGSVTTVLKTSDDGGVTWSNLTARDTHVPLNFTPFLPNFALVLARVLCKIATVP